LVVEDDAVVARALERSLRRAGYRVTRAASCKEARAVEGPFGAGVFDIDLADGDGVTLAAELREARVVSRCVFFTGSASNEHHARAQSVGPVVLKSAPLAELLDTLRLEFQRLGG
jgi:DNA-binding response OmpR family regulator